MTPRNVIPEGTEPAHPMVVELSDILRALYQHIRDNYQETINQAFDQASREIGFVVATTAPMTFGVGERGRLEGCGIPDESPLKGTLLDRTLTKAIQPMREKPLPITKPGTYTIYLIWPPALKLKLYKEWMEPAHWVGPWTEPAHLAQIVQDRARWAGAEQAIRLVWESHEPAHWFNRSVAISAEDAIHLSLLDEIYPELRLMDRVVASRSAAQQFIPPEVKEPAHFRQLISAIPELPKEMLAELAQVLRRYGF